MDDDFFGSMGPQDCCPIELDLTNLSQFCTMMPRPQLVQGIFVQWLRQHFSGTLENPLLQSYVWTNDITTTKIVIDSVFKWRPEMTESRPGLFVKRGPWKVLRYGIDDRKMLGTTNRPCMPVHNAMYQGSQTIFCVAGESAEAELLVAEVYREIMQFAPKARKVLNFLRLVVTDIGEVSILEESKERFVVPVVISYGAQDVWQICPDGLKE